jgi:hypothetical protein
MCDTGSIATSSDVLGGLLLVAASLPAAVSMALDAASARAMLDFMTGVPSEKASRGMVREAFADVLLDRAVWTHARLAAGRRHGVDLHEVTITQDLLLDIGATLPGLTVRTFSNLEEGRVGADWQWDWWFGGSRWFGLRVQAKRLKRVRGAVGYDLGYVVGRARHRQIDLLMAGAAADGLEAAYVLYNGPDLELTFPWLCRRLPPSASFFGVSVLPAVAARSLVNSRTTTLPAVGGHSRPWSCLMTCDPVGGCGRAADPVYTRTLDRWRFQELGGDIGATSYDLAYWVAVSFRRMTEQFRYGGGWSDLQERQMHAQVAESLRGEPPAYVDRLLSGEGVRVHMPGSVRAITIVDVEG